MFSIINSCDIPKIAQAERLYFKGEGWSESMLESAFASGNFLGYKIEEDGELLAYLGFTLSPFDAEIVFLAVANSFRRKGYAYKLIGECVKFCKEKNLEKIFLEVRKSNFGAIALYEKAGFKKIGERKNYYPDGESCLNMALSIKE